MAILVEEMSEGHVMMSLRHILIVGYLWLGANGWGVAGPPVELVVDEWPPYIDSGASDKGLMSTLVVEAFARVGISTHIVFKPWKRVSDIEIDQHDAVSYGWVKNSERLRKWHYSQSLLDTEEVLVAGREFDHPIDTIEKLKPFRIGVSLGYSYGEPFEQEKKHLQLVVANSEAKNLPLIYHKRLDLFLTQKWVALALIHKLYPYEGKRFKIITQTPFATTTNHLVCAKHYSGCLPLIKQFDQGLQALKTDGRWQAILDTAEKKLTNP